MLKSLVPGLLILCQCVQPLAKFENGKWGADVQWLTDLWINHLQFSIDKFRQ